MPTPNPATELEDKTVTLTLTKSFTMEGYTGAMEIEYGGHLTIMGSGAVLDTQGAGAACFEPAAVLILLDEHKSFQYIRRVGHDNAKCKAGE